VGSKKAWFGYGMYAVLVALCSLYFRFPAAEVGDYLDRSIKGMNPDLSFAAAMIRPWPPLRLRFTDMQVVSTGADVPLVVADNLVAGPQIRSMVQGKPIYVFKGEAYGGEFNGRLERHSDSAPLGSASLSFTGIDLAEYKYLSEQLGRHLGGILGGSVDFQSDTDHLLDNEGRTKLRVTDGRVELLQPLFGLDAIEFNDLTVEATLTNGVLTANMEFDGPELRGTVSGTVRVLADIGQSRLSFKGMIEPQAQLGQLYPQAAAAFNLLKKKMRNGKYSFVVSGTVQQPNFSIL
jgi:type II secretion system protein N